MSRISLILGENISILICPKTEQALKELEAQFTEQEKKRREVDMWGDKMSVEELNNAMGEMRERKLQFVIGILRMVNDKQGMSRRCMLFVSNHNKNRRN